MSRVLPASDEKMFAIALVAISLLLLGCGAREEREPVLVAPASAGKVEPAKTAVSREGRRWSKLVTQSEYGEEWPLVVNEAEIHCEKFSGQVQALTVTAGRTTYAINGTARAKGFPDLWPMWLDDDSNPPSKISIHRLSKDTRALCP